METCLTCCLSYYCCGVNGETLQECETSCSWQDLDPGPPLLQAAAEAKGTAAAPQVGAAQGPDVPEEGCCDLPRMVRISKPKCFSKTFLAF